jgi:hypothetical protein
VSKKAPDPGLGSPTLFFSCTQVLVMIQPFFFMLPYELLPSVVPLIAL